MNFLVIGSGAREHIIAKKLKEAGAVVFSILTNKNPGLINLSERTLFVNNYLTFKSKVIDFSLKNNIECVVIGPEDPLAQGYADAFYSKGIPVVGPTKSLARIETSKGYTRDLLDKYQIDASPKYKRFKSLEGVEDYIGYLSNEYVIKFDGLMGGKGVKVSGEHLNDIEAALDYCKQIISNNGTFVVEEKLIGEEFSLMSFSDGKNSAHMPAIQDHKRAFEGDVGPNTGGMGCYSDANHSLPFLKDNEVEEAKIINEKVSSALLQSTGEKYKGILYGGFMVTGNGVKLIEYNARFGDPEAMNLLTLLDDDFASICYSIANGSINEINFLKEASVCKYIVPKGYGNNPAKDATLVVDEFFSNDSDLYYAAVNLGEDGSITTTSSRSAAVVATGESISKAEQKCERGLSFIKGDKLFIRHDIAKPSLIKKRIDNMESIR